ncbi:hypothetical protein Syun_009124 [Stephania yunnanensis]|uniref:Uncharacterized protein n=1 Tax=Stephania yunnanensis TaxID=152371 RepID=A0AAP0KF01_9MAGN
MFAPSNSEPAARTYAMSFTAWRDSSWWSRAPSRSKLGVLHHPHEALDKFTQNPNKSRFRLGGLVLEGSVAQPSSSPFMEFVVTDLIT